VGKRGGGELRTGETTQHTVTRRDILHLNEMRMPSGHHRAEEAAGAAQWRWVVGLSRWGIE
jgi:hypothetical protein